MRRWFDLDDTYLNRYIEYNDNISTSFKGDIANDRANRVNEYKIEFFTRYNLVVTITIKSFIITSLDDNSYQKHIAKYGEPKIFNTIIRVKYYNEQKLNPEQAKFLNFLDLKHIKYFTYRGCIMGHEKFSNYIINNEELNRNFNSEKIILKCGMT